MPATLLYALAQARALTDGLFAQLTPRGFLQRAIPERHRLVFYLGHLEAFDWNLLWRDTARRAAKKPEWENLFAFGIDPVDGELPGEPESFWPSVAEVRAWALSLRADVDEVLATHPRQGYLEGEWATRIALEHRAMHAETLMYLINRLGPDARLLPPPPADVDAPAPTSAWRDIPTGRATLGLARAEAPFEGWCNEYERHTVEVPAFRVQRFPVTHTDYLRFIEAGGYAQRRYWGEDWDWKEAAGLNHPDAWRRDGARWTVLAAGHAVALPAAWPVHVSHAEAKAYCAWAGGRLMGEAEYHRAALGTPSGEERRYPWGDEAPRPGVHGNFAFARQAPAPVTAHPAGDSAFGLSDVVGNGWEWTGTPFAPFQGFRPLPFYPGYSSNFFDGRHFVMKGASQWTPVEFLRPSFRNWFQGHYPYVPAKFRVVEVA